MQQANSLMEILQLQPDADAKVEVLAKIVSTQITATLNGLLTVVSAVDQVPGVDRESIRRDLNELKSLATADVDRHLYNQTIDLIASRLSPEQK
ncbi:hypothetical protein [Pseudomonas sp. BNK-43-a]|uniref:hypothetical protein n=1 Tax=unclassified Pseudomonas TaxID=196821 RepID=UPI0039BEF88A